MNPAVSHVRLLLFFLYIVMCIVVAINCIRIIWKDLLSQSVLKNNLTAEWNYFGNMSDIVNCIDKLSEVSSVTSNTRRSSVEHNKRNNDSIMNIVFMGDSRIRQQFYSFLRILPDYDRLWKGEPDIKKYGHYDMDVLFPLLSLRVSYRWRIVVNRQIVEEIRNLSKSLNPSFSFLLIGINVHHMFPGNGKVAVGHDTYAKHLKELAPQLEQLSVRGARVVWMVNQPSLDSAFFDNKVRESYVHLDRVLQYNKVALSILSKETNRVEFFYSTDLVAMDYIRGCAQNKRVDVYTNFNCYHWIHLGYIVVDYNTKQLVDMLCI